MNEVRLGMCQGQYCAAAGGRDLAAQCTLQDVPFEVLPCQSLCSYAPTAKVDGVALLHADMDDILARLHG